MGHSVISFKHDGARWFAVWSSVVDAPITCALTEAELVDWANWQHGERGAVGWAAAIRFAKELGTSERGSSSAKDTAGINRAGRNETRLTWEQLKGQMVRQRREPRFQLDGVAWRDLCAACSEEMTGERRSDEWGEEYHPKCL